MSASTLPVLAPDPLTTRVLRLLPGVALAALVGVVSLLLASIETRAFGHPVIEGLVVAILLGMAVRTLWVPPRMIDAGVQFTATQVLEVAVLLLGASVDLPLLIRAGPALALGIVLLVVLGIAFSYGIGRAVGLPHKLAVLVACGNSICGNSAIAAIAPVIRADKQHVASSIAFTAILGVVVVIGLPFLMYPLKLSFYQYGVLAGLTVYSVPQVLAAAFPVSALSGQVGTLVKLVRVLMLGPVVLFFALMHRNDVGARDRKVLGFRLTRLVPWFIIGFLMLAALRSSGVIPEADANVMKNASTWLTVASMAALGLGVDLKAIRKVGKPVILTVTASLAVLIALSVTLLRVLAIQ
ncbi:MAG TPA: putative sulfate exporter family transporter [Gemmatimonadaceae bacterium]|nr:putative sulfate exporter family transporter [Gemmatimonadaceae bacterium]